MTKRYSIIRFDAGQGDPQEGSGLLVFCVIITVVFTILVGISTNLLNLQNKHVEDQYHRSQALSAAEAGMGHAISVVETSKAPLDVQLHYGTRYQVAFNQCSTVATRRLWSINVTGWSIDQKTTWTVQQFVIETLPGGTCDVVQGSWINKEGVLSGTTCP